MFSVDREHVAGLDPGQALRELAVRLLEAYAVDPGNASLAREARMTLLAIPPDAGEDPLGGLRELLDPS